MKILVGGRWTSGFPDYARGPRDLRVEVLAWLNLNRLEDLYFVRPRSWRLLMNYLREIGPRDVVRKILSRSQEHHRNEKFLSCGMGRVVDGPEEAAHLRGRLVGFVAPSHPACVERLVLPAAFVRPCNVPGDLALKDQEILYRGLDHTRAADRTRSVVAGWSPHSGVSPEDERIQAEVDDIIVSLRTERFERARRLPVTRGDWPAEQLRSLNRPGSRPGRAPSAILFGYGNYAKTTILPNFEPAVLIEAVHEIDPTQIPLARIDERRWDTAPLLREKEYADVVLAAGYHASHAPVAIGALLRGASAVVEKPVVVDEAQLDDLLEAMASSSGALFACFQRRYSALTHWARDDLRLAPGDPVSYHCVVYEVPLPERHWYRWPSSGSRLLSNGCHWVDHFLFLNGFATVSSLEVSAGRDLVTCFLELRNGATFTMALTDQGSPRLGVRDHVELRVRDRTATLMDNSMYVAEDAERVIRRGKANKTQSYRIMYADIARRIREGSGGDSPESVRASAETVLALERRFWEVCRPATVR